MIHTLLLALALVGQTPTPPTPTPTMPAPSAATPAPAATGVDLGPDAYAIVPAVSAALGASVGWGVLYWREGLTMPRLDALTLVLPPAMSAIGAFIGSIIVGDPLNAVMSPVAAGLGSLVAFPLAAGAVLGLTYCGVVAGMGFDMLTGL